MVWKEFTISLHVVPPYAALAAASSPLGVIGGALAGHGVATLVILCFKLNIDLEWQCLVIDSTSGCEDLLF